jgi:hypothetical protein
MALLAQYQQLQRTKNKRLLGSITFLCKGEETWRFARLHMENDTQQSADAPTPETDAVVTSCVVFHGPQSVDNMVLADFARKLERERDEALAALQKAAWGDYEASAERDQWKECAIKLARALNDAPCGEWGSKDVAIRELQKLKGETK